MSLHRGKKRFSSTRPLKLETLENRQMLASVALAGDTDDHGDDFSSATLLELGAMTHGVLDQADDVDWFRFDLTAATNIEVRMDLLSTDLSFVDKDGATTLVDTESRVLRYNFENPGVYYVSVARRRQMGDYSLVVHELVDAEGNNAASALPLPTDEFVEGDIQHPGDEDWFKIDVDQATRIFVDTHLAYLDWEDPTEEHGYLWDSTLRVLDRDGMTELGFNDDRYEGTYPIEDVYDSFLAVDLPAPGTYYIVVAARSRGDLGEYQVKVDVAQSLEFGHTYAGFLPEAPRDRTEEDWFYVTPPAGTNHIVVDVRRDSPGWVSARLSVADLPGLAVSLNSASDAYGRRTKYYLNTSSRAPILFTVQSRDSDGYRFSVRPATNGELDGISAVSAASRIDSICSRIKWDEIRDRNDDFNGDGEVTEADISVLVEDTFGTVMGDANFDGRVNSLDLNSLAVNWQDRHRQGWAGGNFACDHRVDEDDLQVIASNWQVDVGDSLRAPRAALVSSPRPTDAASVLDSYGDGVNWQQPAKQVSNARRRFDQLVQANRRLKRRAQVLVDYAMMSERESTTRAHQRTSSVDVVWRQTFDNARLPSCESDEMFDPQSPPTCIRFSPPQRGPQL